MIDIQQFVLTFRQHPMAGVLLLWSGAVILREPEAILAILRTNAYYCCSVLLESKLALIDSLLLFYIIYWFENKEGGSVVIGLIAVILLFFYRILSFTRLGKRVGIVRHQSSSTAKSHSIGIGRFRAGLQVLAPNRSRYDSGQGIEVNKVKWIIVIIKGITIAIACRSFWVFVKLLFL